MQKGLYLWVLHSPQMGTHSPWVLVTDGKTSVTQPDDSNVSSQPMRVQLRESQEVFAKGQVWDRPCSGSVCQEVLHRAGQVKFPGLPS